METEGVWIDKRARRRFSAVGFIMLMIVVMMEAVGMLLSYFILRFHLRDKTWLLELFHLFPIYLTGFPLALFFFGMMDSIRIPKRRIPFSRLFQIFLICLPVMYGGNIIGMLLSMLLSHGQATSPVETALTDMSWLDTLTIVVIGPVVEEVLCRKMIIDHTLRYGERTAIVFSALCFGLLHRNFFQFFYAFGLGLVFGYVYLRSGRLRYTIGYHMTINFLGGVIGPVLLRLVDYDALAELAASGSEAEMTAFFTENAGGLLFAYGYVILMIVGALAGIAFLILRRREIYFYRTPDQLERGTVICTVYLSIGVLLFFAVCVLMMIWSLV